MPTSFAAAGLTLANERRDFPEWHLGRPRYALWALDVDVAPVRQRVQAAQRHLAEFLLDGYQRQPHITLSLCGFPSDTPRHADDFGLDALRAQLDALRQARLEPFEIEIGALDSFTSAPYLTVGDAGGHIAALRRCLTGEAGGEPGFTYTPHVTVGLYADAWPTAAVQARLDSFACAAPLRLRVTGVSLMAYAAGEIGGPLERMADYDFGSMMWITKNDVTGEIILKPKDEDRRQRNLQKLFKMIEDAPFTEDFIPERAIAAPRNPFEEWAEPLPAPGSQP